MRLSEKELYRINILKQAHGYEKTPQLIRYWITRDIEKMLEDGRLRKRSSLSHFCSSNLSGKNVATWI